MVMSTLLVLLLVLVVQSAFYQCCCILLLWRRPFPPHIRPSPSKAAVLSRGAMLTFGADGEVAAGGMSSINGTGPGGFGASPISVALARPLALRPAGITADAATAVLPLRVRERKALNSIARPRDGWSKGGMTRLCWHSVFINGHEKAALAASGNCT